MTAIRKTHANQTDANVALLNRVARLGQCSWTDLYCFFGDQDATGKEMQPGPLRRFNAKLGYLVYSGQLQRSGRGQHQVLSLGPKALGVTALAPQVRQALCPDDRMAMPRCNDVIHAPMYQPPRQQSLRPGSLDFLRIASRGNRC